MIETTIVAHDAAEIEILADALQSIAAYRRREAKAELAQLDEPAPDSFTVTVAEPPKRRGRPPKSEAAAPTQPAPEAAPAEPAQAEPAAESRSEPAPAPAPAAPALTLETVRAALANASQAGKTAGVRAALAAVKATKLTEVDPSKYQELLDKVNAL